MGARGIWALTLAVIVVASSVAAQPEEPTDEAPSRATELFKEGRAAMAAKDYDTACAKFAESQELLPARGTQLNLAVCQEARGQLVQALQGFRSFLDGLPESDKRFAFARDMLDALERRVPTLTLQLAPELSPETSVARDGVGLAASEIGTPLLLDPGKHVIEVRVPGHEDRRYEVSLDEGKHQTLTLRAGPKEGLMEEEAPDIDPEPATPPLAIAGFVLGGLGIAGVVVGAVTGGLAIDKKSIVDAECGPEVCRSQEGVDAASDGATLSVVSTTTFIIGGAFLATGIVLVILGLSGDDDLAIWPGGISGRF